VETPVDQKKEKKSVPGLPKTEKRKVVIYSFEFHEVTSKKKKKAGSRRFRRVRGDRGFAKTEIPLGQLA